jgi:hypothetical protein
MEEVCTSSIVRRQTSILGLGAENLGLVVGVMVVVGAVEDADVWLVVESAAETVDVRWCWDWSVQQVAC